MALFQSTVVQKYLKAQDQNELQHKWEAFQAHFHNPSIQQNIRNAKEEQYQEGFLRDLFVNILGYTLNPDTNFNLTTELKNVKDAKKADGGILVKDKVVGVIELKGTNTTDLSKVETQAFGYKNNQTNCTYVITSNFEKLRFYIDNAIEHQAFNLFELTQAQFNLMYLCLAYKNISKDTPKKIKTDSLSQEDAVTKQLYKDYSLFKRELFNNLTQLNPDVDALLLFKKSQKLLDRFLFLFFAEDRHLLPPNSVRMILKQWKQLQELDAYTPLYKRFKKYFGYLNSGHKGKQYDVYPYNGGLFKPDEVLDKVKIDDDLLYAHTLKLSEYDFDSEVDVNILGHIFENSLNEIEEIQTQLEENYSSPNGFKPIETVSKRKKDGVFYTPKYITKYIVENTVGKLCEEQKETLNLVEDDYQLNRKKKTKEQLLQKLKDYRDWLLQLTIVDPACGSGAFLNEALNFLIAEHQYVDELETKLMGGGFVFPNVENSILENNLFGVDINNESVEIAKLSLWLRTAQPNRKLNDLSGNIKCGNSLIDDPEVAGDKAFNWEKEFPQVFGKAGAEQSRSRGFDVVIGNPPYVPAELISQKDKNYLDKKYVSAFGRINLYPLFYEKGIKILKYNGILSYITPYTILKNKYFVESRKFILQNSSILNLIDFKGEIVFADAAVDSIILTLEKSLNDNSEFKYVGDTSKFIIGDYSYINVKQKSILNKKDFSFNISIHDALIKRLSEGCKPMKEIVNFKQGIITGGNKKFLTDLEDETTEKVITGSNFNRYFITNSLEYIKYLPEKLHRPRTRDIFEVSEKILLRQTSSFPICTIDYNQLYSLDTVHNGILIDQNFLIEYVVALLNSKFFKFLYENSINETGKIFAQVKIIYVAELPIKKSDKEIQLSFREITVQILSLNKDLEVVSSKFQRNLQRQFPEELEKLPKKLQDWYALSFADFIKELKKKKIKLSLSQEAEWEDYFLAEQQKATSLKNQIDQTDKEIDQMVYELYGLTEDEIKIVEEA